MRACSALRPSKAAVGVPTKRQVMIPKPRALHFPANVIELLRAHVERSRSRSGCQPLERGYCFRCHMVRGVRAARPEAVLPDRVLCSPTFSHFLIVNLIQIYRISRPIYSGIRKYRSRPLAWTLHVIFPPPQPNSQILTSALDIPSGSNKSLRVSSEPYD